MIRHFDGSVEQAEKIGAEAQRGEVKAVEWTTGKHRIVPTLKEADRVKAIWKRWKERQGFTVQSVHGSFRASAPGQSPSEVAMTTRIPREKWMEMWVDEKR